MAENELKLPEREMPMTVTKHMWSTFFCPKCGHMLFAGLFRTFIDDINYCHHCGQRVVVKIDDTDEWREQ